MHCSRDEPDHHVPGPALTLRGVQRVVEPVPLVHRHVHAGADVTRRRVRYPRRGEHLVDLLVRQTQVRLAEHIADAAQDGVREEWLCLGHVHIVAGPPDAAKMSRAAIGKSASGRRGGFVSR